jgi:gliding motility-associated-like protein
MKNPSFLPMVAIKAILLASSLVIFASDRCHAQVASFTADVTSGCFPVTVKFADTSAPAGAITSWAWNFGNSNTSTLQHPSAVYSSAGTYTVSLTITTASGSDSEIKTGYINVHDYPSVDFSFDKSIGCTPLKVKFKDESEAGSGSITNWLWSFGDGASSTAANPEYTFTTPGDRFVTLKVTNQFGCARTKTGASPINVTGPHAAFTPNSISVCQVPSTIQFENESTGNGVLTYNWSFGDGGTSTAFEPSHVYTQPGTYTTVLKARDPSGCESTHSVMIKVANEDGLYFTPSATKVCEGQTVTFNSTADFPVITRLWDFGNSSGSADEDPSVTYTAGGNYAVTLTALLQGKACESKVTKTIEVVSLPNPSFDYSADCNYNVTFKNTSTKSHRVEWYIGNVFRSSAENFTFSLAPGNPKVTLIAYNSLGCSQTLEKNITISSKPVPSFLPNLEQDCIAPSLSGCAPFTLQLTNQSISTSAFTSLWKFGDGSTSPDKDPPPHTSGVGNFTLKLIVTSAAGCKDSISRRVTVANEIPVAKFIFNKNKVCARQEVSFTNQSEKATFWCWDFGDGSTFSGRDVKHSYTKPGKYTVRLTAKNAGCTAVSEIVDAIEVLDPEVNFEITKNCNDPYKINFLNLSVNCTSLVWDFGDGATSTVDVTSHRFDATGQYAVKLQGSNATTGCTTEMSLPVFIQDIKADFEIDNPKPCKGVTVRFTDKSEFAVRHEWTFGASGFSASQNPSTIFSIAGTHSIVLNAYDADGCVDQKVLPLTVLDIQGNFSFTATSTCDELTVQFTDHSIATPALQSWEWDFGDGQTSLVKDPENIYQSTGTYPIKLTLKNSDGECTFIKEDAVLFTNPIPEFFASKSGACISEKITLTNSTANASTFEWDFGDGRPTTTDTHAQVSYPATGKYSITLDATDQYGCTVSLTKPEFISITKPVADFDAFDTFSDCPPLISSFRDKSTGNVKQWLWNFGEGRYSVLPAPVYTYLRPGVFDVTLIATDVNGCSDTTQVERLVSVGGPYGTFSAGIPVTTCVDQNIPFFASTTNAVTHRWDFGDGTVENHGADMEAEHVYTSSGGYQTSLVLIDEKGCTVVADGDVRVIINDTTKIDFDYSPKCIFEGESFILESNADESDLAWEWFIGNQLVSLAEDVSIALDTAGEHLVTLRVTNQYGCISSITHAVPVYGNVTFIPNVFTPNRDDYNSFFMIKDLEKSNWNLQIFNRYGNPVYEKNNYMNDWDGSDVSGGVYYYYLVNSFCQDRNYKGTLSIMR